MLVVLLLSQDTKKLEEAIQCSPLKQKFKKTKGVYILPIKGYKESEFLQTALLLKYLYDNKIIKKYKIEHTTGNIFLRELKTCLELFISTGELIIPTKIIYIAESPICFQLLKYKIDYISKEDLVKYKTLTALPNQSETITTNCITRTRRYTYPTLPSITLLITSIKSKINTELNHVHPNPIQLATMMKDENQTVVYEVFRREKIKQIQITEKGRFINKKVINIESNYTDTLSPRKFKHYNEIIKFITLNDIYKLLGITEEILTRDTLFNFINNPNTILKNFRKIQIKYYLLENNNILIDSVNLQDKQSKIYTIQNTHLLARIGNSLILKNAGLYFTFKSYAEYYSFFKQNFQKLMSRKNKEYLLI